MQIINRRTLLALNGVLLALTLLPHSTSAAETADQGLGEFVQIVQGEREFAFPSRYFAASPSARSKDHGSQWESFSISFWFPDLLPPKRYTAYVPSFRPEEPGRSPGPDTFIVKIKAITTRSAASTDPLPADKYRNLRNFGDRYQSAGEQFELFTHLDSYEQNPSDMYFSLRANQQLSMHCNRFPPKSQFAVNPACLAFFFYPNSRIEFALMFPSDQISKWREIEKNALFILNRYLIAGAPID